jgi:hypothetical protein
MIGKGRTCDRQKFDQARLGIAVIAWREIAEAYY